MTDNLEQKVIAIIAEQAMLTPEDVSPEATLDALGVDSLGLVEAIFAIEETFDIQVPFNANEPGESSFDISTVQSIIIAVEKLVKEAR
ncbi:MAG: phosphopantetheine-binding protein [Rhodobacteraceae bacterium]|nr:phosphopantetheine-binding protein [Paracoccaceae bacterium]